jgi:two-component system OmpR family sensor kinase
MAMTLFERRPAFGRRRGTRADPPLFQDLSALPREEGRVRAGKRERPRQRILMKIRRNRQDRRAVVRMPPTKGPTVRETALAARVAELEAELRARDDFLAIAAHELRNPMTPISARLELLLARARHMSGSVPAGLVHGLELLEELVNAYLRRATTLLEVARASSGKLNLQTAEVDLSALVRQVTANMLPLAESAGCEVRLIVEDGVSAGCDPMAIEQILENLLSNAIRFGPGRPVEVSFASDGEFTRLSVRDEGVGISDCDRALIFERFHRSRRANPNGGFGVGLWVTRELVRAMHGEISVASRPGAGSAFTVRLPLRPGSAEHAD